MTVTATAKTEAVTSQGAIWRGQEVQVNTAPGEVSTWYKEYVFGSKNNYSLQQHPHGHGRVPTAQGFQGAIGLTVTKWHLDSLFHERLDHRIFWDCCQPGMFYDSMTVYL